MSEQRRKQQQKRVGGAEAKVPSRKMLIWGGVAMLFVLAYAGRLVLQESPLRWLCEVSGIEAGEDVWLVLVSALCRAEGNVWESLSVRSLYRVCDQGLAGTGTGVFGGWGEVISELAVWIQSAERRGLSAGRAFRQNWVQSAVSAASNQPTASNPASVAPATKDNRLLFVAIAILALAGMVVSAVSLQRHYAKSASAFCDFGERFDCDIVNRSEYSSLMGIPVAGIGIAGYGVLLALATICRSRRRRHYGCWWRLWRDWRSLSI